LARATGEEAFVDLNSNGVADPGEMIDANGCSTDMGEAYVDYNEDGKWDPATEPYVDFNSDKTYNGSTSGVGTAACPAIVGGTSKGDGKYNGVLCNAVATPTFCSAQKSIDVRGSQVIVFSGSFANITINGGAQIDLPPCTNGTGLGAPKTFVVTVVDRNGNAMPAGTTVAFAASNGKVMTGTYTVPDTIGCRTEYSGCPASAAGATFGDVGVTAQTDATYDDTKGTCTNTVRTGGFSVTVTSPKGNVTSATVNITD
jgi:hypothetical protein